MAKYRHFETEWIDDICVLRLARGDWGSGLTASDLDYELQLLRKSENPRKVVVNFRAVRSCGSGVMNALLRLRRQIVEAHGRIKLAGMNAVVREAYDIAKLIPVMFETYDHPWDAIEAIRNGT